MTTRFFAMAESALMNGTYNFAIPIRHQIKQRLVLVINGGRPVAAQ